MSRQDISQYLVHWTSGADDEEACERLLSILIEMQLKANDENIKGNYPCICFTEAPESEFHKVRSRYRPFGIQVPKKWLYHLGGRPVIYQTDEEYELLPIEIRWRHVRYEPNRVPPIDFTWEREWRIWDFEVDLDPENMRVLLPSEEWAQELISNYTDNQLLELMWEACAYGEAYEGPAPEGFLLNYSIIGE